MIIATFGIIQASLILLSLNAIIQGCTCLTHKTKTRTSKSAELALRSCGLQTAPLFPTPEFCFMARQLMPKT